MQYFVKIGRKRFFDFYDGHRTQCWIFKFIVTARVETTNVHRHTNFVKTGQTVAEISHLTIVSVAAVRHLGCFKILCLE